MKIAKFDAGTGAQIGIIENEEIHALNYDGSMIDLIKDWENLETELKSVNTGRSYTLANVKLLSPVERPGKVFAIGLNYADHIEESQMAAPTEQVWFTKAVTSVTGPYDPIQIPKVSQFVDYEAELVAVIGKGGKHISEENAADHVFGFCVGNDVTERLWQHRVPQWSLGKSFDTHAPIGPWITTTDSGIDPHTLDIRCWVNDELRQESNTRHLHYNVWQQVAHLSQAMTLEPGDLIFTGTPGGVGAAMEPRQFLKPGDHLRTEIDHLGIIEGVMTPE